MDDMKRKERAKSRFRERCYPLENGCIGFKGYHDKDGYPHYYGDLKSKLATHFALEYEGIEVPKGQQANHHCDNPKCVNAEHLFVGTQKDNVMDMIGKDRHALGERHTVSILTDSAVRDIRSNWSCTSVQTFAQRYGVCKSTIYAAKKGQNWSHVDA